MANTVGSACRSNSPNRFDRLLRVTLPCVSILSMAPAWSQTDNSGGVLEEVTVTAQKRAERAQDVGISIAAYSGEMLQDLNIKRTEDLAVLTPGLTTAAAAGSSVSQFNLRGVGQGDYADHHEQPNAVYVDGVYVALPGATGFPLYDLQTVEVLRGPQGTLFGRNATGGLLHFQSNKPTQDFHAGLELTGAEFNNYRADGFVNGGLTEHLSARLSFYGNTQDGWVKNTDGPNLMTDTLFSPRLQLLYDSLEGTTLRLIVTGYHQQDRAGVYKATPSYLNRSTGYTQFVPPGVDIYGTGPGNDLYGYRDPNSDPWTVGADTIGYIIKNNYSTSATLDHDFGGVSLTSISAFQRMGTEYREDTDSTPLAQAIYTAGADAKEYSEELRLQHTTGPTRWISGLYLLKIDGRFSADFNLPTLEDLQSTGADMFNDYTLDTKSWAVFSQVEQDITSQWTVIGGLRYTGDEKDLNLHTFCTQTAPTACHDLFLVGDTDANGNLLPTSANLGHIALSRHDRDWSGRLQVNYHPLDDLLLYASANKGTKGGGFSIDLNGYLSPNQLPYAPEKLFAYEIGEKSQFADGHVRLNSSVYYYDYRNFQTFQFLGISSQVLNRPARAKGAETELTWKPDRSIDVVLGGAYSDFIVHDVLALYAPEGIDQRPNNDPKWKLDWLLRKSWSVFGNEEIAVQYDAAYTGSRYYNIQNTETVYAAGYTLHNLNASLGAADGKWRVSVWANNVTNHRYITDAFDLSSVGYTIQRYGMPRQVGGTFSISY